MGADLGDLNARARGLSTRLLRREDLTALARQPDLPSLAAALERAKVVGRGGAAGAEALELSVRRWGGGMLRLLGRWAGTRSAALPLIYDAEDRRSIRSLLRGAAVQAPAGQRLAGSLPTPTLPERALEALAAAPTVAAMWALLSAWHHPFAPVLAPHASDARPDLLMLELALGRAAALAATAAARRSGSGALRRFVRDGIDLENGVLALLLTGAGDEVRAEDHFREGGRRLNRERFLAAAGAASPAAAGSLVAGALAGTPFARLFATGASDPARLEEGLDSRRLDDLTRQVRLSPLEPTTTLWFAWRLRAQVVDLQRIIWTVALDAPRQPLVDRLGSAAA